MLETLQKLEYELLNNAGLKVYDYIPEDDENEYVVIGDVSAKPFYSKTFDGYEVTSTIWIYSNTRTTLNAKRTIQKIIDCLKNVEVQKEKYYIEFYDIANADCMRIDLDLIQGKVSIVYRVEED